MSRTAVLAALTSLFAFAEIPRPRFEDYPIREKWTRPTASVKLVTPSERMFRAKLTEAAKQSPNFAGHYRITFWGCGSNCSASALIDLQSGSVHPLPLHTGSTGWERWMECTACFENTGTQFRLESRLLVERCGWNYDDKGENHPDVYYFVWEGTRFRQLLHIQPPKLLE